jgi:ParB family chromosome partitioning protein
VTTMTATQPTFADIPLRDISVSATNPRKQFKPDALEDLAASIRKHGILQPILIRPIAKGFEIVAGERRYRASKIAGVEKVPCRIKDMSDAEALEVQVIENLQREDVHPLEEAQGYAELLKLPGYDVAAIADKIGRSMTYVRGRLSMLDGIPEVRAAFAAESITASHMRIICKLQPEKQAEALENCFESYGDKKLLPVSDLRDWIAGEMGMDLDRAPFQLLDADLVESAGACVTCPKSSCVDGKLFGDQSGDDLCYDRVCFGSKVKAIIARHIADGLPMISRAWGKEDLPEGTLRRDDYTVITADDEEDECAHVESAVVVSQQGAGSVMKICRNERCPVHGEPLQETKQRSERATQSSNDWQEQHRQAEAKRKAELEARQRAAKAIIQQARQLGLAAYNLLQLNELLDGCRNVDKDRLASMMTARGIAVRPTANSWEATAGAKAQLMLWAREEASTHEVEELIIELLISNRIAASPDRRIKFADEAKPETGGDTDDDAEEIEEVEDELGFDALKFVAEELRLDWDQITAPPAESKPKGKKKAKA